MTGISRSEEGIGEDKSLIWEELSKQEVARACGRHYDVYRTRLGNKTLREVSKALMGKRRHNFLSPIGP